MANTQQIYDPISGVLSGPYGTNARSMAPSSVPAGSSLNLSNLSEYRDYLDLLQERINSNYYGDSPATPESGGGGNMDYYSSSYGSPSVTEGSDSGNYSVSEYFGGKNTEEYRKYQEGKSQGKWKDLPDYISQNQTNPADDILNSQLKRIEEEKGWLEEYTSSNPFAFDEELAKESATAEYAPYYTELLDDYMKGIELKRDSLESDKNLLTTLKGYEDAKSSRDFARAESQVSEGFAGSGMFFSGIKDRAVGNLEVDKTVNNELSNIGYQDSLGKYYRQGQALDIDASNRERDLERDKKASIEGGILQRKGEAITQYNTPLSQSYTRRFGGSGADLLSGYTVPDYLRY